MLVCYDYTGGGEAVDCSDANHDNTYSEKIPQPGGLGMTLIIRDQLVNPPTWFTSFRDLTLYCHVFMRDDIVIESDDPDPYYRWMRPRGGMDFVEDFVRPGAEDGVHLDLEHNYPRTVVTDRIAPENVHSLIRLILFCRGAA
jgi:hypothetical protein